jgi:hypothetical protein
LNKLEKIRTGITGLTPDIKAEVIVSQLLSRGISWYEVMVHADHFFSRRFDRDIARMEVQETPGAEDVLHFHLTRTGLYDLLPEGIFFTPVPSDKSPKNAGEMAEEYKANQKTEAAVRRFFSPFENEFFYHRVKNFEMEVALLNGLKDESLNRYFTRFWNLPQSMPPAMAIKLILLLPYVHQIAGDASLMAASLQTIIGNTVSCRQYTETVQDTGLAYNELGRYQLGNEFTCGKNYFEADFCFEFTIHLEVAAAPTVYLPGGRLYPVLETFRRFFVPVMADVHTILKLPQEKEQLQLGDGSGALLGIATVI